jgi:tetratricopeptide (TPR) repeat protein
MQKNNRERFSDYLPNWLWSNTVPILFLVFFTTILYGNTLHSPFALDDYHNILANKPIRITEISYAKLKEVGQKSLLVNRPVANISLALNYYFHQYNVKGYHLFNIAVHILTGILLYIFVRKTLLLLQNKSRNEAKWIAFIASLLWLVHPLQTQSVTYIIQRMNSLAALFYLLSFVLYIMARTTPGAMKKFILAICSVSAGLLAIGSKENAVILPAFILLYEWYFFQNLQFKFKKHHYLIIAVLLTFSIGAAFFYLGNNPFESIIIGYGGRDFTLQERLLTQLRVVVFYISLIFLPYPSRMTLEHDFLISNSLFTPLTTFTSLIFIGILCYSVLLLAKKERLLSFCILWFLGNLLIESTIIPLEIIFEHRTYLPSMLIILLGILVIHRMIMSLRTKVILVCLVTLFFTSWTYARNSIWQDELSLWADIAQKAPNKSRAQMNLGIILSKENRMDESLVYLKRAVQLDPNYDLAHYSLGDALMKQNKFIQASEAYAKGLQLKPDNPLTRFNLAKALAASGKHANALFHYRLVAGKDPFINHQIYYHMGNSLYQLKRYDEALISYNKALRTKSDFYEARQAYNNTRKLIEILNKQQPAIQ